MTQPMHDWIFEKASVDWKEAVARLEFNAGGKLKVVRAIGLSDMHLSRQLSWGESIYVNVCKGPTKLQSGGYGLAIEMQTGDIIELVAAQFEMPPL
jgi:hypothetical protein